MNAHTAEVKISRQYRSANTGELVDALSVEGWDALRHRIAATEPLGVREYADTRSTGIVVTVAESRGARGAYALHDLACRFGAPAVIL